MSITITDIITEHGAHYKKGGQGAKDLISMMYHNDDATDRIFTIIPTENTKLEKASAEITSVIQRYQTQFTPKGDTAFEPRSIDLHKIKVDASANPDEIEQSWLGFLASDKQSRKDWPFPKYWIEQLIMPQVQEDLLLDAYFNGELGTITPGTATASTAVMNGMKKVINDHITAGDIVPIVTGAPDADAVTYADQVHDFWEAIPEKFKRSIKSIQMSPALARRYYDGMRIKWNMGYDQIDRTLIRDTKVEIIGWDAQIGSNKIWCTVDKNAAMGFKKPGNDMIFKVEEARRTVDAMTDFYKGVGFFIPEFAFVNDQDLAV